MIHEEICTYEVAKLAKEKGFNWICPHYFRLNNKDLYMVFPSEDWSYISERINAPTQSLLQRWLREEKGVIVIPYYRSVLRMWSATYELTSPCTFEDLSKCFKTYEQALDHALKYALERLN